MSLDLYMRSRRLFVQKVLNFVSFRYKSIFIGRGSKLGCKLFIDKGSRLNSNFFCRGSGEVLIGKYCAFGHNIRIITSNHPYDMPNLQYDLQKKITDRLIDNESSKVVINNNVWIGDNVIILPGVTIGNGAIIGAGSVVTKNVPAYSIFAGNPAKFIKFRFSEQSIALIEESKWWEWDLEKMRSHRSFFLNRFSNE